MATVFKNDSPVYLKEQGHEEELLRVMKLFYEPGEVQNRLDALSAESAKEGTSASEGQEETFKETFFDPRIRGAAWVGFWLATFQ